ncbi:MAG: glycosyltransferase [Hyphomicrobiaceae bacterium]|nr:glycosyltransferase [Hyphomicrobiaceae bacterium]
MTFVSVVIPLYETERYIAHAINSVLAQTYTDFEIVVVDDGSKDGGPAIARSYSDPRIRVVSQANRGLAGARNTGIREARGRYIALLDADDAWQPEKLETLVAALERDSGAGIAFCASRFIDDDGNPLGLYQRPQRLKFEAADVFCRNPVGNGSVPVIRREALDAIAFYDARYERVCWFDESFRQSEDIECWTRLAALTAWRFVYVDAALTDYRVNSSGLSANTARQLETWRRFRSKVAGYAPDLERHHGALAEAYQLRYLARRAVRGNAGRAALRMSLQAIATSPRILLEEPVRTVTTVAAASLQTLLPRSLFASLETWAMNQSAQRSSTAAGRDAVRT